MTDDELIAAIEQIRNTLIAVATGGPRIGDVDAQFHQTRRAVATELARRRLRRSNPV